MLKHIYIINLIPRGPPLQLKLLLREEARVKAATWDVSKRENISKTVLFYGIWFLVGSTRAGVQFNLDHVLHFVRVVIWINPMTRSALLQCTWLLFYPTLVPLGWGLIPGKRVVSKQKILRNLELILSSSSYLPLTSRRCASFRLLNSTTNLLDNLIARVVVYAS